MKHTKNWKVTHHTTSNLPYKYMVSEVQESDEEAEFNAKLIAAAPELLEALIELSECDYTSGTHLSCAIIKANNAIKKATE